MKLFINARFLTQPISGVQRYAIECSRQIKELYPECVFVAPKDIVNHEVAAELGAIVVGKRTGHKWEQIDLPLYLWRHKTPSLLNLCNTAPLIYGNNYIVIHDMAFFHHPEWNSKAFSAWYNILIPRIAMNGRHLFTVSETIRQELVANYKLPASKISVTYNGVAEVFKNSETAFSEPKEKIILSVGTFNIRKNQQNLVKGFLQSELVKNYILVLVGDKNKVFAESGIDENELNNERIKVYIHVTDADLISLYTKAEVLVSLSEYEGFGIPVLEGLAMGCKVLCSDIAVYRELYKQHVSFCDPHNTGAIAASLNMLATQDRSFDKESINLLLERYSYKKAAEVIIGNIKSLRKI